MKNKKSKRQVFSKRKRQIVTGLIIVAAVASIGTYLLWPSHADTAVSPRLLGGTTTLTNYTAYPQNFASPTPWPIPATNAKGGQLVHVDAGSAFNQSTVNNAGANAMFVFGAGTWTGSRTVINPASGDSFYGQGNGSTVLNSYRFIATNSDPDVTIANLKILGYWESPGNSNGSYQKPATIDSNLNNSLQSGWQVYNNDVSGGNGGIFVGDNSVVQNNYSHDNDYLGIAGGDNSVFRYNATIRNGGISDSNKSGYAHGQEWYGNYMADSPYLAPGMWCDDFCTSNFYHDNISVRNSMNGMMMEIGFQYVGNGNDLPLTSCGRPVPGGGQVYNPTKSGANGLLASACGSVFDHNIVAGNGSWNNWQADNILISSSQGQTVTNNYAWGGGDGGSSGSADIQVYCQGRGTTNGTCSGNQVTGNHVSTAIGVSGSTNDDISNNTIMTVAAMDSIVPKMCAGPQPYGVNLAAGQCTAAPSTSPYISTISATHGVAAGGGQIIISGGNFASPAIVKFGTASATNVTVVNSTTITATIPSGPIGTVTVSVTTAGTTANLADGYTYDTPPGPYGGSAPKLSTTATRIETENYDVGGEGVAFHDQATSNLGASTYRGSDAVGVKDEVASNNHVVGFFQVGDWLNYTVSTTMAGTATLTLHAANIASDATLGVSVDGKSVATAAVPNTGDYATFQDSQPVTFALASGTHTIRLTGAAAASGYVGDIDYSTVTLAPSQTPPPTVISGDINNDGHVNTLDLSILLTHDGENYAPADLNKDGTVGAADLAVLLSHWTW